MTIANQFVQNAGVLRKPNLPNGYVGIDSSGDVLGTFAQRRDTAANIAAIVLANGELAFTEDTQELFIGDGTTAGGLFVYQKPQVKNLTLASLVSAPALGSATDLTSIVFLKTLGATYQVDLFAKFVGETAAISNFAVQFKMQSVPDWLINSQALSLLHAEWFDIASPFLRIESSHQITTTTSQGLTGVSVSLSAAARDRTTASLRLSTRLKVSANLADLTSPLMAFTPIPRTGSTSAAGCDVYATCQRIA